MMMMSIWVCLLLCVLSALVGVALCLIYRVRIDAVKQHVTDELQAMEIRMTNLILGAKIAANAEIAKAATTAKTGIDKL